MAEVEFSEKEEKAAMIQRHPLAYSILWMVVLYSVVCLIGIYMLSFGGFIAFLGWLFLLSQGIVVLMIVVMVFIPMFLNSLRGGNPMSRVWDGAHAMLPDLRVENGIQPEAMGKITFDSLGEIEMRSESKEAVRDFFGTMKSITPLECAASEELDQYLRRLILFSHPAVPISIKKLCAERAITRGMHLPAVAEFASQNSAYSHFRENWLSGNDRTGQSAGKAHAIAREAHLKARWYGPSNRARAAEWVAEAAENLADSRFADATSTVARALVYGEDFEYKNQLNDLTNLMQNTTANPIP